VRDDREQGVGDQFVNTHTISVATASLVTLNDVSAGHSSTPLAAKLGIKAGQRLTFVGAPREWSIDDLPKDVQVVRRRGSAESDVVVAFFNDAASLNRQITSLAKAVTTNGSLWIAWPRRAAGHTSDITDNVVRSTVLPSGLVDVKVAALDDNWSALKFMWRRELRDRR
jgi:hypothetical protein